MKRTALLALLISATSAFAENECLVNGKTVITSMSCASYAKLFSQPADQSKPSPSETWQSKRQAREAAEKAAIKQRENERYEAERRERLIQAGYLFNGMTTYEVRRAIGSPTTTSVTRGAYGTVEIWLYKGYRTAKVIQFEDDKVTSITESQR